MKENKRCVPTKVYENGELLSPKCKNCRAFFADANNPPPCHHSTLELVERMVKQGKEALDELSKLSDTITSETILKNLPHQEDKSNRGWEEKLREYIDKTLKPKKPTIGGLDREIIIDFTRQLLSSEYKRGREEAVKELNVGKLGKAKALGLQFHGKNKLDAFMDGFRTARNNLQEQKVALLTKEELK